MISAIPREQNMSTKGIQFLVTSRTEVRFVAHAYTFVYCLDMSPSHANVDIDGKEVLFDQILKSFKISIEGLSKQVSYNFNCSKLCLYFTLSVYTRRSICANLLF